MITDRDPSKAHDRARRAPARGGVSSRLPPFERVIEAHGPALLRFSAAQAGADQAHDVFQETMLSALRAYDQVRNPASIRSWLYSIAMRKALDSHRARARDPQPVADLEASAPPARAAAAPAGDDALWARVRELPDKQRQAVALRFLGDLSHREIAVAMQTSEAAARRNVFEALRRLRGDLARSHEAAPPAVQRS